MKKVLFVILFTIISLTFFYGCFPSVSSGENLPVLNKTNYSARTVNNGETAEELAKKGYEYWQKGDYNYYDEAIDYLKKAIEKDPDNAEYHGSLGRMIFDYGDEKEAKSELEKSLSLKKGEAWVYAWDHIILGEIYEMEGNYKKALEHYKAAVELKATKNSTKEAQGRVKILTEWKKTESEHFVFNYPSGGYTEKNIKSIVSKYEKAYKNISTFLGVKVPGKIFYYLFPSRQSGLDVLGYEPGFSRTGNNQIYALMGEKEQQTAGHEMSHVISFYISSKINSDVLIHEGLAEMLNQEGEDFHGEVAYLLESGSFIPLKELRKNFRSYDTQTAYNEAASFVKFLIDTGGIDKFKKVWVREDFEKSLLEVYGKSYDELGNSWEEMVKKSKPVEWEGAESLEKELNEELKFLYDPNFPFNDK